MRTIHSLILWSVALLGNASLYAESPAEIYQRRVIPLLQAPAGSSCAECHLQGVKLTDFLSTDPKETFAALRARGWIYANRPTESKILQFIAKKPEKSTELMNQVRRAEVEAITAWIQASLADPDSLNTPLPKLDDLKLDEKLIQHARRDQVVSRFVDVIWSQFERCANCHSPDRNSKQVEQHGEQMSWIVPNSPEETLQLLEERKLINLNNPTESMLRTKALGLEDHGGGIKFPKDGQTDREWLNFLTDYAAIKQARYTSSSELPNFATIRTWRNGLHLRIKDLPNLAAGQYAVIRMRRILPDEKDAEDAVAIGEGRANKEGTSWSTTIMLLEPPQLRQTEQAVPWATLMTDGRYQVEWVIVDDSSHPIEKILALPAMKIAVIDSLWKAGHGNAKTISYSEFQ